MKQMDNKSCKDFIYQGGYDSNPNFKESYTEYSPSTPIRNKRESSLHTVKSEKKKIASLKLKISVIKNSLDKTYKFLREPRTQKARIIKNKILGEIKRDSSKRVNRITRVQSRRKSVPNKNMINSKRKTKLNTFMQT
ncbi:unnamed protein product [Moneuplotes crassus]|uniref:Uncharacterized protein n=1 Tax=Euplotes crassus TaxID=5936 RepID=A0AAD2DAU9_EUPCR|nr:unnamed protein product [Moneuplotes crassus]